MSLSMMPPCVVALSGRVWRLEMLTPATSTLLTFGSARIDLAGLAACPCPRAPGPGHPCGFASQITSGASETMRMKRLSRSSRPNGAEDAGPARLQLVVDEDRGVLVEADVAAVRTPLLLLRAHDHAADDVALLHRGARHGVLHRRDEDVADAGVAARRTAEHLDAEDLFGTGVVGDPEFATPAGSSGTLQDLDEAPALQLR